ncbi:hypothetical protein BC830DRAFT_1225647 [Chytriomyces sp. MP71]|nr:hypothetical protein BC830DRAFT_1225647 [Chytriomyces sp. MP71]
MSFDKHLANDGSQTVAAASLRISELTITSFSDPSNVPFTTTDTLFVVLTSLAAKIAQAGSVWWITMLFWKKICKV